MKVSVYTLNYSCKWKCLSWFDLLNAVTPVKQSQIQEHHMISLTTKLLIWSNVRRIRSHKHCFKNTLVLLLVTNLYKQQQGILFRNSSFVDEFMFFVEVLHVVILGMWRKLNVQKHRNLTSFITCSETLRDSLRKLNNHLSNFTIRWVLMIILTFFVFICFNLFEISLCF